MVQNFWGFTVGILTTCQQITVEAAAVLYGHNQFIFDEACDGMICGHPDCGTHVECDMTVMYIWLCLIGARNRYFLRRIQIRITSPAFLCCERKFRYFDDRLMPWCYAVEVFLGKAFSLLAKATSLN